MRYSLSASRVRGRPARGVAWLLLCKPSLGEHVTHSPPHCRESEAPNDLGCEEQGFFTAGYERAGIFQASQTAGFPHSSALCCRPCFSPPPPGSTPSDAAAAAAAAADVVAVVSTGCVQSRWEGGGQACPPNTFITGYSTAMLGAPIERYYPVGQATCCRPTLLLRNGSQRLLSSCTAGCAAQTDGSQVSCAPSDDAGGVQMAGRLIHGWGSVLREPGAQLGLSDAIPMGPAQCCGICLDTATPARSLPCEAANFCSAHGACSAYGQCVCDHGWTGASCAQAVEPAVALLSSAPFLVVAALFVGICFAGMAARSASLSAALTATRRAAAAAAAARRAEMEAPLLVSSDDDDAEWGSEVSSDDGEEGGGAGPYQPPQVVPAGDDGGDDAPDTVQAADEDADAGEEVGKCGGEELEAVTAQPSDRAQQPRRNYLRNAPECNVCMDARVQIVFLPCGHACACRPCSRKLRRCPICRVLVAKRQKLFISSGLE